MWYHLQTSRVGLLSLVIVISALGDTALGQQDRHPESDQTASSESQNVADSLSQMFRQAAATAMPAVVKIESMSRRGPVGGGPGRDTGSNRGRPGGAPEQPFVGPPLPSSGIGSGVIIDRSGIILTSAHEAIGFAQVVVTLADGRTFPAIDLKADPRTDLALVRIDAKEDLPVARFGDSTALRVGDWIVALGHPFGLDASASAGIISGTDRRVSGYDRVRLLQTDAVLNPGNSGGPLVNLRGEVIGIQSSLISSSGGNSGIAFAAPIDLAKWVADELIEHGHVRRAGMGLEADTLSAELAEQWGLPAQTHGVVVTDVSPDGPAARAGLRIGDVITRFGQRPVRSAPQWEQLVERSPAGAEQPVTILRDGETRTLTPKLTALPAEPGGAAVGGPERPAHVNERLGLAVSRLTPERAERLGYEAERGILVTGVDPLGPAYQKGLRENMIILRVGRTLVSTLRQYEEAVSEQSRAAGVVLLVKAADGNRFVVLEL